MDRQKNFKANVFHNYQNHNPDYLSEIILCIFLSVLMVFSHETLQVQMENATFTNSPSYQPQLRRL